MSHHLYNNISGSDISGYVETGVSTIERLASLGDIKKKREYDFALANLNIDQQRKLNQDLLRSKSNEERFAILTKAKTQLEEARTKDKAKNNIKLALIVVGGSIVLLLGVILIKKM